MGSKTPRVWGALRRPRSGRPAGFSSASPGQTQARPTAHPGGGPAGPQALLLSEQGPRRLTGQDQGAPTAGGFESEHTHGRFAHPKGSHKGL